MNIESNQFPQQSIASKSIQDGEVAGFVMKTFQILGVQQYQKIIYWASSENEFVIKDVVKFQEIVLPKYFRHNKMNSFVRQLNMYGFHKIKHNNFKSTFRHEYFQKNREDLLPLIRRKPKLNEKDQQNYEETRLPSAPVKQQKTPMLIKQQEQPTMAHQKWANISQQFLATTKMINLSLIKVTCNQLTDFTNPIAEQQDCVSIEDELEKEQDRGQMQEMFDFQNVSCFFASRFDL